ncbi:MAG: head GIN domain-containing protein [Flavobacterium sp.]
MMNFKLLLNGIFKALFIAMLLITISGCTDDSMPDCFRTAGDMVEYDVTVDAFSSIKISEGIELVITQGDEQRVTIKTAENFKPEISAQTINGQLQLNNSTSCNWVRDYNLTRVYVTTPNLENIYSASQFDVKSDGILAFPSLKLSSGLYGKTASGSWLLTVDCQSLTIEDNQSSYYNISGTAENLTINFYAGDSRFDGTNLSSQKLQVFHRSSNDIIAKPELEARGTLYSTGNLVLKTRPTVVEVHRLYHGEVKYE